jgi:prefoldin subunit 5
MELQMSDITIETARELATHANDIAHLQADMDKLVQEMSEIKTAIQSIEKTLSEAKGGWKALLWAGGAVSALTGIVGFVMGHWGK